MRQKLWKKVGIVFAALVMCTAVAVPTFAASKADDRSLGYTMQVLRQGQDVPEVTDEDIGVDAPLPIGAAISFNDLNGDTGNIGVGTRSARNRAMNDSMGQADLIALMNPLRIGVAAVVRI